LVARLELASGQITNCDAIIVELVEADEHPAVIIVRRPQKPSVVQPRRFPDVAAMIVQLFSQAHTALAGIKARKKL
jgi:hypothetical protein